MQDFSFKKVFFMLLLAISQGIVINFDSKLIAGEQVKEVECSVCLVDLDPSYMIGFSCRHTICAGCMKLHIEAYERDRGSGLRCPDKDCLRQISSNEIRSDLEQWNFLLDEQVVVDLMRILDEQKIEATRAVYTAHVDPASKKLIEQTSKPCPQCQMPFEKNNGCNHMTCEKCKYQFCWVCRREWRGHAMGMNGNYNCSYDPNNPANAQNVYGQQVQHGNVMRERVINARDYTGLGIAGFGGAAIALGAGIAYNTSRSIRRPIRQITHVESNQMPPSSWLAQKLNSSKQKLSNFAGNLKNKLTSKKSNWASTAIATGVGLEAFAALYATNFNLSAGINNYLANNHDMYVDLQHPINIVLSLAVASLVRPICRLVTKKNIINTLVEDEDFLHLMKARTVQDITVSQEQLLTYCKQVASINPYDITRLEMRKQVDISISNVDDIDGVLRMCLIYNKAQELRREVFVGIEEQLTALENMLLELPHRPLRDSVENFLRDTRHEYLMKRDTRL